ncbi:hypothetical protein [Leptotrichia sp. oral taxon 879]|uniref:hypothetical protein n=1 Tax=Leptotrichia sp. oral taxon 879 TaxID=1227267 RepID=UPI0003ADF48E|nr:hypothetical protein [Leptotrichia sp. oral taxon 879]ERK49795.1 hypothetical protein HMPREF1552_01633 [Leptotrichia sp. oral taxon 879 str. F0557]
MLKKIGIAMLIVASLGMSVTRNKSKVGKLQKTVKESNQANAKLSSEDKEAINTAVNFMNEYIRIENPDEFDKWFAKAPITEKFRKEFQRREKYMELSQKALAGKLTPDEKKFLKENEDITYDYDPLLAAGIMDIREESEFQLKKYDSKSKTVYLKDKYEEDFVVDGRKGHQGGTEITLKLVKQNRKWLIDESK